jgi:hypothetical protein
MIIDKPPPREPPKAPPPPAQAPLLGKPFEPQLAFSSQGFDAGFQDWVTRLLKSWGLETIAPATTLLISTYARNPLLLFYTISGLLALAGAVFSASYAIGALFVNYVLVAVQLLQVSIGGSILGFAVLAGGMWLFAVGWVSASRWHPVAFGFLEMIMGVGASLGGFSEAQSEFAALFALIGGVFTVIDGCQRVADAKDRKTSPVSSG